MESPDKDQAMVTVTVDQPSQVAVTGLSEPGVFVLR